MDTLFVFKVYLLYGLAFFAIFFAILFRDLKNSQIAIASTLPILGAFGFLHGLHEWTELYFVIYAEDHPLTLELQTFITLKLWLSFIAMGWFSWKMLDLTSWRYLGLIKLASLVAVSLFLISLGLRYGSVSYFEYLIDTSDHIRWMFGFGSSALAGFAVISYASVLEREGHGAALPFKYTGASLVAYGISAGLLTADMGLWVLVLRASCAALILVTLWKALEVFDRERKKQIETALAHSLQDAKLIELGELVSAVAHEIKTPISSAMMSCDLLRHQAPKDEVVTRQIDRINHGLSRAAEISQEILNYAHQKPVQRKPVNLSEVVNSAFSLNQFRLTDFNVEASLDEELTVLGDEGLLEAVFSNIIGNAIDASVDDKYLHIQTLQSKLKAVVKISDHGSGMSDDVLARATQPFFTTKPKGEGTGMGLALCKQMILQHGGKLLFKNNDRGLTVVIELPRKM
ncbi:sensor histidine kinase [Vibrio ishigakensis]|uniref:sensor histidine kinase n=1 Tax=Vibrio ishigakensis TaxID=1481914 RepID=UPI0021C2F0F3|nr:HAMP domain-containing sensor histidine kinase [Vibrio ishigakensis]